MSVKPWQYYWAMVRGRPRCVWGGHRWGEVDGLCVVGQRTDHGSIVSVMTGPDARYGGEHRQCRDCLAWNRQYGECGFNGHLTRQHGIA